jgi:2-keto-4-pentenoate hydratase
MTMSPDRIEAACDALWQAWRTTTRIAAIPAQARPADRAEGYAVQAALARRSGDAPYGWKIAATSPAGQAHIGVDGPLAGRLLASRMLAPGATVPLAGNQMRVAEVEFAYRLARPLPPRAQPYSVDETMAAVGSLHPTIEIPDSRYEDFVTAGAPQLIADFACANWLVVGPAVGGDWHQRPLAAHAVSATIDGRPVATGSGAAVLGDPRVALTWIANELRVHGEGLKAGELVTTGTSVVPVAIAPGQTFVADYGPIGTLSVTLA